MSEVPTRSRESHLAGVKSYALRVLAADPEGGGPRQALVAIISDLRKHPGTADHVGIELAAGLLVGGGAGADGVRQFIEECE